MSTLSREYPMLGMPARPYGAGRGAEPAPHTRPRSPTARHLILGIALGLSGAACGGASRTPMPHPGVSMMAVGHPAAAPFSSICRLEVHRRHVNGLVVTEHAAVSTGSLVDRNHLLTARHNFSSPPHRPVTARAVECGRQGNLVDRSRTDRFRREHVRVLPEYKGSIAHDYAVVHVGEVAPFGPGFRLPRDGEAALRRGDTVHVAGYPLDHHGYNGKRLYHAAGLVRATSRDSTFFVYGVETRGGMSGSPVWIARRGPDGRPEYIVVGVHVGRQYVKGRLWALARRIDREALGIVQGWLAADTAD